MDIAKLLNEYEKCVEICSKIDYSNKNSVKANNKAVTKMYSILNKVKDDNMSDIKAFYQFLDNETTGKWFSHQLLELFQVDKDTEKKALKIIIKLSRKELGEKYWLDNYYKNKGNGN